MRTLALREYYTKRQTNSDMTATSAPDSSNDVLSSGELDVDVVIVGAGFSGIATLYRTRKLGLKSVILEASDGFGGVWHHNRYPGARVDSEWPFYQLNIPEVYTTFSFRERFPGHDELREYMTHVDKVLDLKKDTIFDAFVNDCSWAEQTAKWTVKTKQGHIVRGQYLIICSGLLHQRHIPQLPGMENFHGEIVHSAAWPKSTTTKGKRVALVGAGATAVQITQEVAKDAEHLTVLMRRPSMCIPMRQRPLSVEENNGFRTYFDVLLTQGRNSYAGFPTARPTQRAVQAAPEQREERFEDLWQRGGFQFLWAYADTAIDKDANKLVYEYWSRKTRQRMRPGKKRDLMAPPPETMPYFFGTRRTPLEQDYYECLDQDNVDVVNVNQQKIKTFTEDSIVFDDGGSLKIDLLALATGFDSFSGSVTNMGLKNKDGVNIKEVWADGIKTYLGLTFGGFPNCFMVYSPHAPTAFSNGPTILEAQADLVTNFIVQCREANVRSVDPKEDAQDQWVDMVDQMANQTLFPLTDSWWNASNIPGKKNQALVYIGGIYKYEPQCKAALDAMEGFDVEYWKDSRQQQPHSQVAAAPS